MAKLSFKASQQHNKGNIFIYKGHKYIIGIDWACDCKGSK